MDELILRYLSEKIVADLRNNKLQEEIATSVDRQPFVDCIRNYIFDEDFEWMKQILKDQKWNSIWELTSSLLFKLEGSEHVKNFIQNLWDTRDDYKSKYWIMWRLLDNKKIDLKYHQSVYDFIKCNWDQWIMDCKNWIGNDDIFLYIENRIEDTSIPITKKWIYLCMSFIITDSKRTLILLDKLSDTNIKFIEEIRNELKNKIK